MGHELQLVTNYLGAFELTGTLLPLFRGDAPARIVNVGSLAHRFARLDLDDLNWEKTSYNEWKAYARSKLAMVSFTMDYGPTGFLEIRGAPGKARVNPIANDVGVGSRLWMPPSR